MSNANVMTVKINLVRHPRFWLKLKEQPADVVVDEIEKMTRTSVEEIVVNVIRILGAVRNLQSVNVKSVAMSGVKEFTKRKMIQDRICQSTMAN